jgi:transposase
LARVQRSRSGQGPQRQSNTARRLGVIATVWPAGQVTVLACRSTVKASRVKPPGTAGHSRIRHTIPERDDQKANRARKGARGGRPPAFDRVRYRSRNQVERLMNRRKQFRAVATRFDKLAERYAATVAVADIFIWLRARPDRSRGDPRNTP